MKSKMRHFRPLVCVFFAWMIIVGLIVATSAVTNFTVDGLTIDTTSKGNASWTYGADSITANAVTSTDRCDDVTQQNGSITIKNTSGEDRYLSFKYTVTNTSSSYKGTVTVTYPDQTTSTLSGENQDFKYLLESTKSVTITIASPANAGKSTSNTVSFSITYVTFPPNRVNNVTLGSATNGSFTVTYEGTSYGPGSVIPVAGGGSVTLNATPNSGYVFNVWQYFAESGNKSLTTSATYTFTVSENCTITPSFVAAVSKAPFMVGSTPYYTWEAAFTAAGSNGTVVLNDIYALPTTYEANGMSGSGTYVTGTNGALNYTLKSGQTLLLPYSASDYDIKSGTNQTNDFKHANVAFGTSTSVANTSKLDPESNATYTLTLPEKCTLEVADGTATTVGNCGRIVIGGTIVGVEGNASTVFEGATYGAHSNLVVDGNLVLGKYAVLSVAGYILGEGEISATATGAEIYQPLVIHDWRGAGVAPMFVNSSLNAKVTIQSGASEISPYSQWSTFNIQTKLTMNSGNLMYMYASLTEDGAAYCSHPLMIGDSTSGGLLQLASKAVLTSVYEEIDWSGSANIYGFPGVTTISIHGGASVGSMAMSIKLTLGSMSVDTGTMTLPISYCYAFILNSGDYYVDNSIALLPGASITVNRGAVLYIGKTKVTRFAVFDGLNHRVSQHNGTTLAYMANTRANTKNYPTTSEIQAAKIGEKNLSGDAELIINGGTLVIGEHASFGGLVQTTGTGTIDATAGTKDATISTTVQIGVVGAKTILGKARYVAGMSLHTLTARVISAGTKESVNILRGYTYSASSYTGTQESYSFKYYPASGNAGYVVLVGNATLASGETLVAADGTTTTGATAQAAHPLNETIYGAWCANHNASSGMCPNCNLFDFYATNVNLGNNLDMLFAFPQNENASYAVFTRTGHVPVSIDIDKTKTVLIGNTVYYYVTYSGFAAKEMCETITVTVYNADGDVLSMSRTDSIRDYAKRLLAKYSTDATKAELCTLIVDMLNYGAACQTYFGYNTNDLANDGITGTGSDYTLPTSYTTPDKTYFSGTNVITTSNIQFALAPGATITSATYTYKNHWGTEVTGDLKYNQEKGYYYIDTLVMADAMSEITITVNGDTTNLYKETIENYCARMHSKAATDAEKAVFEAFMKFSVSAEAYLEQTDGGRLP